MPIRERYAKKGNETTSFERGFKVIVFLSVLGWLFIYAQVDGMPMRSDKALAANQKSTTLMSFLESSCGPMAQVPIHDGMCRELFDAVKLVEEPPEPSGGDISDRALFRFDLLMAGGEKAVGPFLSRRDCSVVAARLVQIGAHVTTCLPYEPWPHALLFAQGDT